MNTYAYVGGNPLLNIDPLGLAYPIPEREGRVGEDPCGCFKKAILGIEDIVVGTGMGAGAAATGGFSLKPRGGMSGGGRSGRSTSWWSKRVHEHNKKHGKTARSRASRKMGRKIITKIYTWGRSSSVYF